MSLIVGRRISGRFLSQPYLLLRDQILALNLCKQGTVKIPIPPEEELFQSRRIGSSKGWVVVTKLKDPRTLHITNLYNPFACDKVVVSLPPLDIGLLTGVRISLSASPDKEDCVVAAKLDTPFISLCRPGDSEWTHIETPGTRFSSKVMYSVRDQRFYLYLSSTLRKTNQVKTCSNDFPPVHAYQSLPFSNIPESIEDLIKSTILRRQYLVEAPTGDSFTVVWCTEGLKKDRRRLETKAFMVFRQEHEQGICSYTQDIGDLCIFLGSNEGFCVYATEYPGLNPNTVYFADHMMGFGYYDLISNTVHDLTHLDSSIFPLWLAPLH